MSGPDRTPLSNAAQQVVAKRAGPSASAAALAVAARRTYEEFAREATPLIGQRGVEALISRAVHLARRQYPWLGADGAVSAPPGDDTFAEVARSLEQAERGAATEASGVVFGLSAGLLETLIGDRLTASLLYKAWPDAFPIPTKRSDNE